MTIHVLAVRVTVIHAVMILAWPPTGLLLKYCTVYVSPPTVAARYQYHDNRALDNDAVTLVYETVTSDSQWRLKLH